MKDFCRRELKHNDLVVSKPGGRNARMRYGLIRTELNSVWFEPYSHGGSDIILIETEKHPDLEEIRQNLIKKREKDIADREKEKQDKKNRKLKKSQLKRFGIYECGNEYDREIYLGKCEIDGEVVENVWMTIESTFAVFPDKHNDEYRKYVRFPEEKALLEFWSSSFYNRALPQKYRSVKYPQKFKEVTVLSEKDIKQLHQESRIRMCKRYPYLSDREGKFIEIVF